MGSWEVGKLEDKMSQKKIRNLSSKIKSNKWPINYVSGSGSFQNIIKLRLVLFTTRFKSFQFNQGLLKGFR